MSILFLVRIWEDIFHLTNKNTGQIQAYFKYINIYKYILVRYVYHSTLLCKKCSFQFAKYFFPSNLVVDIDSN